MITAPRPECRTDPECPLHLACINEECKNPCVSFSCGINANCEVHRHRATCACQIGYEGDPYTICVERKSHCASSLYSFLTFAQLLHLSGFSLIQPVVAVMKSAAFIWLASIGSVKIPACMKNAAFELSAASLTIRPSATAHRT